MKKSLSLFLIIALIFCGCAGENPKDNAEEGTSEPEKALDAD